jgi:hypothetical protein
MNIDELNGRQLDLAVARHVFGHQVEEHPNLRTGEMDAVYSTSARSSNATWVRVPLYGTTPSASAQVEVQLRKRGWTRTDPLAGAPGDVRVVLKHEDGQVVEAFGPLDAALCRAALKAMQEAN